MQALADSGPPPALLAGFKLGDGLQCHTEGSSWPQPHFLLPIFQICLNSSLMAFLSLFFLSPTLYRADHLVPSQDIQGPHAC